jgi:ligand-binding sensor domain-containing protein
MRRCVWLGSLALALVSLAVAVILGCPAVARAQLPEWVVYNTHNSRLPHDDGYTLTVDAHGNIWRGTERGGAARTNGMGDWSFYNRSNSGLPHNDVICIAFDGQGNAWMGTWGLGVAKFDGSEGWTEYNTSNSELPDSFVVTLATDGQGNVWMGTHGGLAKFDGARDWTVYNTSNSELPGDTIRAVVTDGRGNVWMSVYGEGVAKLEGAEGWTVYDTSNSGLHSHDFAYWALAFDPEGNLWIGTESKGVAKFDGVEEWTVYNTSNSGLPNDFVNDFAFDDQGNVWMATQGGGVAKFDGVEGWTVYDTSNSGLPYDFIAGVSVDVHGNLWIGTGRAHDDGQSTGGVAVYREGGVVPYGLGAEFASLTSATTTLGVTRVSQQTPLEVTIVLDTPLEAGKTLRVNLAPIGPDLSLEHAGEGRYTVSTTVTPLRNAHYNMPVLVQTAEGVRYRFFLATLDVYPAGDLIVYDDAPGEGWTVEGSIGESDLTSDAFVRTGSCSHAIGPGTAMVKYVCDDPEGIGLFGYSHLEFYVNGGEGSGQNPIVVSKGRSWLVIVPEADTWTRVSIPASDLTSPLSIIRIRGSVEDPFYIDDMRLVAGKPNTKKVETVSP